MQGEKGGGDTNTVLVLPRNFDRLISTSLTLSVLIYVTSHTQYHIGRENQNKQTVRECRWMVLLQYCCCCCCCLRLINERAVGPHPRPVRVYQEERRVGESVVAVVDEEDEGMSQKTNGTTAE